MSNLSYREALMYDMDYITKELDSIETKELEEISRDVCRFLNLISLKIEYRKKTNSR